MLQVFGSQMKILPQFYWWRKPEHPVKTTDLSQVADKLLSHNVVSSTSHMNRIQTHNCLFDKDFNFPISVRFDRQRPQFSFKCTLVLFEKGGRRGSDRTVVFTTTYAILSPLKLWVWILFMWDVLDTTLCDKSLSATCDRSVVKLKSLSNRPYTKS
jgi:hypothetical protein